MSHPGALSDQRTAAVTVVIAVALFTFSITPLEAEPGPILQDSGPPGGFTSSNAAGASRSPTSKDTIIETLPLGGVGGSAASLLLSEHGAGSVEGAVLWTLSRVDLDRNRYDIRFLVEIDGRGLLASSNGPKVHVEICGYLLDPAGTIVTHFAEGVVFDSMPLRRTVEGSGLKFVGAFSVPAGTYSLRILVRNRDTQRYFLGRRELDVRTGTLGNPMVLPPLVAEPDHRWVYSGSRGVNPQQPAGLIPESFVWPSAMPSWKTDRPFEAVIACSQPDEQLLLTSHIIDDEGRTVLNTATHVSTSFASRQNLFFYRVSIDAPLLPPGRYRLAVSVTDSKSGKTTSQSLPVLIHDLRDDLVWTDPAAPRPVVPRPEPPRVEQPEPGAEQQESEPPEQIAETEPVEIDIESLPIGDAIGTLPLAGVAAKAAALLLSGQSGGEIEGAVLWTSTGSETDAHKINIDFFVEIDGRGLLALVEDTTVPIEIYSYLVDANGTVVAHLAEGVLLDRAPLIAAVEHSGLKFVGSLPAPPGLYSFRILVRNPETQRFFLARRDLDVRVGIGATALLLPPLVAEPDDRWVLSGSHGLDLEEFKGRIPGIATWPSAIPAWKSDQPLQAVITCPQLGEERELSTRLIDRLGRRVLDPAIRVSSVITSNQNLFFYRATIDAPDVPAGTYRLEISLTDADTGETVAQSLEVLIHDLDDEFVWTHPNAPRSAAPLPLPRPGQEIVVEDIEAMRDDYVDVLRLWSTGNTLEARRKLAAFEAPLASSSSANAWRQLITVEKLTALTLAKTQPEAVMAIATLHRDMFGWYRARTEPLLARHSWQMVAMLARVVPDLAKSQLAGDFGECLLIDLAGRLVSSGQTESARGLLETAAEVAPHSAPVLLGLGALLERTGFPDLAMDELKKLYETHPDHVEGKLRLAVNRARLGAKESAEDLFRDLLSPSERTWIRALAYQELARLLTTEGRLDEALDLLRGGVEQIPENERLRIQLAHVNDLAGRPIEAVAIVDGLQAPASRQKTSPRYRYSAWPDLDADRVRSILTEAHEVGLGALREALP